MEVDKVMDGLMKELGVAIKAMGKAKKMDEKEAYSRIVKNLSESMGVFLDVVNDMMLYDEDDDDDQYLEKGDIPF
jgi:hypothetical protein